MIQSRFAVAAAALSGLALAGCSGEQGSQSASSGSASSNGSASASWEGETLSFDNARCRAIPGGEEWSLTASSDLNTVQVRYWRNDDGSYDTSSADVTLELMDDNWRVLERYSAHSAELDVSTQERASGELRLTPHHSPGVGQVRAGGGVLRFEINC
ncbi:hypothetical protein F1654_05425 [Alkalicaulis satelles]|uniref:Lipoprotein n=1 Tax=Alkalicaulis satelles TaxID=2609175 RepID=A0A5M6ZM79_9PROT|nr:hypothetical protein [Alkalicaulis satelles]KAA5805420.1 hypothetical protein F1654_05425 [Alkalicaulis satelles]